VELSSEVRLALAGAYGAAPGRMVGTEHLLVGLTASAATVPVLTAAGITKPVVIAVLRKHDGRWQHDDGDTGEWPLGELLRYPARKPMAYTGAARAALHRALAIATEQGDAALDPGHLLSGLLETGGNRATELLHACGVDGRLLPKQDSIAPELRPTRDTLLGIGRAPSRLLALFSVNLAELPVLWVESDARDQARRLGARRPGTEHLVLAILATHETVQHYPHMLPDDTQGRYAGGRVLAAAGLKYRAARDAVEHSADRLGSDARKPSCYTRRSWRWSASMDTGHLLLRILTQDDSRGANLLRLLGVPPQRVRVRLRTP
jgi:Clp amino terminal domain, pathogenicity island component